MTISKAELEGITNKVKEEIFEQAGHSKKKEAHEEIADLVVKKIQCLNRPDRDEAFMKKLAEMLIDTRAPCHNLADEDIVTLKAIIKQKKSFNAGKAAIIIAIIIYAGKKILDFLSLNIHWGLR